MDRRLTAEDTDVTPTTFDFSLAAAGINHIVVSQGHDLHAGPPGSGGTANDTGTITKTHPKTAQPPMYKVVMLNDDYTPMDFVVELFRKIFNKSGPEANQLMLQVHQKGSAICGVYGRDVAETKRDAAMDEAKGNGHPLQLVLERN